MSVYEKGKSNEEETFYNDSCQREVLFAVKDFQEW